VQQRLTTRTAIRDRAQREIAESAAEKYPCLGGAGGGELPLCPPPLSLSLSRARARARRRADLSRATEPDDPRTRYVGYATGNKDH